MRKLAIAVGVVGALVCSTPAFATEFSSTPKQTWSAINGRVYALAQSGNTVYLGGSFTTLRSPDNSTTVTRNHLAAVDVSTNTLLPWNPGASGDVRALKVAGTTLYVGGSGVTAYSTSTGARSYSVSTNGQVRSIDASAGVVYFGGAFTTVNGAGRGHLAAINYDGTLTGFNGAVNGNVNAVDVLSNGNIAVGGSFTRISNATHNFIGSVSPSGSVTGWSPPIPCTDSARPCHVLGLDHTTDTVFAAVSGPGGRVTAYNASANSIRWSRSGDGDVQAIAVSGSTVYAGGHFNPSFGGASRAGIVALSTSGVLNNNFKPRITGNLGVWSILDTGSYLAVGGDFTNIQVNGSYTGERGFALFD